MCNVGYELFTEDGTSEYFIPGYIQIKNFLLMKKKTLLIESENGLRDGDVYRLNKTCVRKMCPSLGAPKNGRLLTESRHYRFTDMVHFMCDFGYIMEGNEALLCNSAGQWNGSVPQCNRESYRQLLILKS